MEIVRKRQRILVEEYNLCFIWKDDPGAGFSFPCTKEGTLLKEQMQPEGLLNLEKCLSGEYDVIAQGIKDYSYSYYEPAIGLCSTCGNRVELEDSYTNTCDGCGSLYNGFGQELAPRSQWEEQEDEEPGLFSDDDIIV